MNRLGLGLLLGLGAGCAGRSGGIHSEDVLPLRDPWTGLYKSGDREPRTISIRPAAPKGRVWLIDLSAFYDGGQYGLLVTSGETGILLHSVLVAGSLLRLDPAQVLVPREVPSTTGWRSSGSEVEIVAEPEEAGPIECRWVEVRSRVKARVTTFKFGLARGTGIAAFAGGAGDLRGDWVFASVVRDPR